MYSLAMAFSRYPHGYVSHHRGKFFAKPGTLPRNGNANNVGGKADTHQVGGRADKHQVGGRADKHQVGGRADKDQVGGACPELVSPANRNAISPHRQTRRGGVRMMRWWRGGVERKE